jgi:hypothetical protein
LKKNFEGWKFVQKFEENIRSWKFEQKFVEKFINFRDQSEGLS